MSPPLSIRPDPSSITGCSAAGAELSGPLAGAHTAPALLEFAGQAWGDEGAAQVGGERISLTYVFPDLPALAPGAALTAGGEAYTVLTYPRREGDGLQAYVLLEAR